MKPKKIQWRQFESGCAGDARYQHDLRAEGGPEFEVGSMVGVVRDRLVELDTPGAVAYFCVVVYAPLPRKTHFQGFITDGERYAYAWPTIPDGEMELCWNWNTDDQIEIVAAIRAYSEQLVN